MTEGELAVVIAIAAGLLGCLIWLSVTYGLARRERRKHVDPLGGEWHRPSPTVRQAIRQQRVKHTDWLWPEWGEIERDKADRTPHARSYKSNRSSR